MYFIRCKKNIPSFIFILFLCLFSISLGAQNKQDLTKKRQNLLKEINKAAKLLSATKKDKKAALGQYYTLQRQIEQRAELIETLQQEIEFSNQSLIRTSGAINALQEDMNRLELEYGEMARQAYRDKINDNKLLFLFSAEGFSDGLKRWRYIQQYDDYRKKQAGLIIETRASLSEKLNGIEIKRAELDDLLVSAENQQQLLKKELSRKNGLLKTLKADESRISRLINRKKVAHRKLSAAIENIIANEIKSRVGSDRINATPSKNAGAGTTAKPTSKNAGSIATSSTAFRRQKGKLTWPVKNGLVTRHFGKQSHPIHKQVQITNNGIDIRATSDNLVFAIYDGQVAGTQYVPGYQNTLIIQHGNYYSVYSNLEKVDVKKGTKVRSGQLIGIAGNNSQNGTLEVHLEIWKGKQRMNPAVWLSQ